MKINDPIFPQMLFSYPQTAKENASTLLGVKLHTLQEKQTIVLCSCCHASTASKLYSYDFHFLMLLKCRHPFTPPRGSSSHMLLPRTILHSSSYSNYLIPFNNLVKDSSFLYNYCFSRLEKNPRHIVGNSTLLKIWYGIILLNGNEV